MAKTQSVPCSVKGMAENRRSAKEVLFELKEVGVKTENKNTRILIEILSASRWTAYELSLLLQEREDYDCRGAGGDKLAALVYEKLLKFKVRYQGKIFDVFRKEWFVEGTMADPGYDYLPAARVKIFGPVYKGGQRRRQGERSLRDLMFEVLKNKGPLEQRDLVFEIKRHPDYYSMHPDHLTLRRAVNGTLRNSSRKKGYCRLFRKISGKRPTRWEAIAVADPPLIRRKPQVETLANLMSMRRIWTVDDLARLAAHPSSGYNLSSSATLNSLKENIYQILRRADERFERIKTPNGNWYWRLKKPQRVVALQDRLEALDLLAQGRKVNQVVEHLSSSYPGWDWPTIRQRYDPNGPFSISQYEGATREAIARAKNRFMELHAELILRINRVHNDPEILGRRLEAQAQNQFSRSLKMQQHLQETNIDLFPSRSGWIVPGDVRDPEKSLLLKERSIIIAEALASLNQEERLMIELIFYNDFSPEEAINLVEGQWDDATAVLQRALAKLAQNKALKEIS